MFASRCEIVAESSNAFGDCPTLNLGKRSLAISGMVFAADQCDINFVRLESGSILIIFA